VGVIALLMLGVAGVGHMAMANLAAAQARNAADFAALSAGRELARRSAMSGRPIDQGGLRAVAERVARDSGARLEEVAVESAAAGRPVEVVVRVAVAGPLGLPVAARSRARVAAAAESASRWATGGGYRGPLVLRDGAPTCPAVARAFDAMDAAAARAGVDLVVVSGFRSDAEQAELFRRHPDPRWVAPPGRSRHRDATELDIASSGGAWAWLAAHAADFGFVQRYAWEPWHWGYRAGCGSAGLPGWVPARYRRTIGRAARAHGLAPALLAALLRVESGFDPRAVSAAGAQGIAQFLPATAAEVGLKDPFDAPRAIDAAARLMAELRERLGSVELALAAYNAGPGAVSRHGGVPPFRETRAYVARVLRLAGEHGVQRSPSSVRLVLD
jgi:soluble lytic murein transglycosylase-like protein